MYIPKRYGQSKIDKCPFCEKQGTLLNKQGVVVCTRHKSETLDNLKCVCGSTLDLLNGKFGVFFSCKRCGNVNLRKALEYNTIKPKTKTEVENKDNVKITSSGKKIITIRSDDPRYFD